ncbi:VOC family protein [Cellulosimicrobium sp. NPDC057127]|uniref:VOC family protein n=1 Tax=Cellulosimicrobium sp. NPDC057127 TaxID=3346026 RepID=UPI003627BA0C
MDVEYIAGFGPIGADASATHDFWAGTLGIGFDELAPGYHHTERLGGAKAFALWPLDQAAQSTFGTPEWPRDHPVPQAWLELEVSSPEAVADAVRELRAAGQEVLRDAHEEPWGQTVARLLSPEGILVGISYLPDFHR